MNKVQREQVKIAKQDFIEEYLENQNSFSLKELLKQYEHRIQEQISI